EEITAARRHERTTARKNDGTKERWNERTMERRNEKRRRREVSRDMPWHVSSGGRNDSMEQETGKMG
ncbi:MAG: hypothetical protein KGY70_19030, partial [Bacteroidales bacterium]|nr:hypothetical protein [Bacteroidales bacterium]